MRIVDAQVHIWAADTPERPWPARHAPHRPEPLSAEELIRHMDAADVHAAILVPPSWEGERNDLVLAACEAYPKRFAAMGRIDPADPALAQTIALWRSHPGAAGLRFTLHRPGMAEALVDGTLDAVWKAAQEHHVPVTLLVPQAQMHHVRAVAERYPRLSITLDHLGVPSSVPMAERFSNLDLLLSLAQFDNVAVKASGLPSLAADAYPYVSVHPHVRKVVDAFGARRVFWGTDMSRLPCTYREASEMFTVHMPWLREDDKEWIMGRGICEWLGLPFMTSE
jgi:predicted TIM-barrel fold metal-dependent hydrolase